MKTRWMRMLLLLNSCALVFALFLMAERRAYAYGDPGSGLLILQGIGSAAMGLLFVCRRKLGKLFYGRKKTPEMPVDAKSDTESTHE